MAFNKFNIKVTATCHDDRLRLVDFSHGDYSDVDFRRATLQGNLSSSSWHRAQVSEAIFDGCILSQASFQHASLISSHFKNLIFTGDFSNARLNNAKVTESHIGQTITLNADLSLFEVGANVLTQDPDNTWVTQLIKDMAVAFPELQEKQRQLRKEFDDFKTEQTQFNTYVENSLSELHDEITPITHSSIHEKVIQNAERLYSKALSIKYAMQNVKTPRSTGEVSYLDMMIDFHNDPAQQILVIHSPVNSGKTTGLYLALRHFNSYVPVPTKGSQLYDTSDNLIEAALRSTHDFVEIEQLRRHGSYTVIIDGLEHCKFDLSNREFAKECEAFNAQCKANWKFIFIATTEYLEFELSDYRDQFQLNHLEKSKRLIQECTVQPPTSEQIKDYLAQYYPQSIEYIHARIGDLPLLIQNVGMLDIICNVLEDLKDDPTQIETHAQIYQCFLNQWEEKVLSKRGAREINAKSISMCVQDHAYAMYVLHADHMELPDSKTESNALERERDHARTELASAADKFSYLWQGTWRKTFKIAPMIIEDGRCRLITPFDHYGLATKLVEFLCDADEHQSTPGRSVERQLRAWNHDYLTQNRYLPSLTLMQQIIEKHPKQQELLNYLYQMVSASGKKQGKQWSIAASNAITLLFMINPKAADRLSRLDEWRGIQVPKARLPHACLSELDLSKSDFSKAYLNGANLTLTSMYSANLTDTSYSGEVADILTPATSECIAAYSASNRLIIACSIQEDPKSEHRSIKLYGEDGQSYPGFKGHHTRIRAMAFGIQHHPLEKSKAYLATTSDNGEKIRFWTFEGAQGKSIGTIQVNYNLRVNSLSWDVSGEMLASGGEDGAVRIWSFNKLMQIFEYLPKDNAPAINSVLFGKKEPILVAAGERFTLLVWQLINTENGLDESPIPIKPPMPEDIHSAITCIDFSPDETKIALGCENGDIYLIPLKGINEYDKIVQCIGGHERSRVHAIHWNERCLVSSGEDKTIRIWNAFTGERMAVYYNDIPVKQLFWSTQRQKLIAIQPGRISLFDPDFATNLSISPDVLHPNTSIAAIQTEVATAHSDGRIWLRSIHTPPHFATQCITHYTEPFVEISWSNNGQYLAARTLGGHIEIMEFNRDVYEIVPHDWEITAFDVEEIRWVGSSLNLLHKDKTVSVYTNHELGWMIGDNSQLSYAPHVSPNGSWSAYIDEANTVFVMSTSTGLPVLKEKGGSSHQRILWVSNGVLTYLLIGSENDIRVFDASNNKISKKPIKTFASGITDWACTEQHLYLMTLMRVDVFNFHLWLQSTPIRGSYLMSWGQGMPLRGYDVRSSKGLDNRRLALLKQFDAQISPPSHFLPALTQTLKLNFLYSAVPEKKLESPPTPKPMSRLSKFRANSIWGPMGTADTPDIPSKRRLSIGLPSVSVVESGQKEFKEDEEKSDGSLSHDEGHIYINI